jgi:predicted Zn-dependent protease
MIAFPFLAFRPVLHRFPALLSAAVLALLAGCAVVPGPQPQGPGGAPDAADRAVSLSTPPQIDMRAQARSFVTVLQIVEPVAEAECRARAPGRNCDFRIVVDDRPGMPPNAFQTRDDAGRPIIAFTLSLIATVANADELAFILSHEAAHHIAGHLDRSNRAATVGATVFGELAGVLGRNSPEAIRTAQEIGAAVAARSFSQDFELEADALGTVIAARAGYDPVQGAQFFLRIPDPGNRFLGTHPPNAERLAVVERTAARLGL